MAKSQYFHRKYKNHRIHTKELGKMIKRCLNADKHSPASSAQSTKRRVAEINEEKERDMRRKQKNNWLRNQ